MPLVLGALKTALNVFLIIALLVIECLIGGTRLVFSLPSYFLIAVAALASVAVRPEPGTKPSTACLVVSALFFSYILARAAHSPVPFLAWPDLFMVLGCLMVYLLVIFPLGGSRERSSLVWALLILATVEVFVGLHQFTRGDNWMPFGFLRADAGQRASGFLISSIHLAGLLEVVGLFALSFALWGLWRGWLRILAAYIGVMCYLGVAITGSRGGYLSALFSLLVFGALSLYVKRKIQPGRFMPAVLATVVAVVVGVGAAVALMHNSELLRGRLAMIPQQFEKNGLDIRIYNWQAALDQYQVQPWVGTGAGTHVYYGRYFRRPPLQSDPIHAHSDYLELLAEYGLVGALGMAAFLLVHVASGWRSMRALVATELHDLPEWKPARHDSLALLIGALSSVAAYLAHSVVDFNLHIPGHALIFAFIFAILASAPEGEGAPPKAAPAAVFRWALPLLAAATLFLGLPKFPAEYWGEKARAALRDLRLEESLVYSAHALESQKKNPDIYFHLGMAHRNLGLLSENREERVAQLEAAVEAFEHGLAIFPQEEHMLVRYAECMDSLGRFNEAERVFLAAIALDRNLGNLHAYYARHLAIVGREEEAEERMAIARKYPTVRSLDRIVRGTSLDPKPGEELP